MITKEQLLARRAQLEVDIAVQQDLAGKSQMQMNQGSVALNHHNNLINALSGAKQDVDYWLAQIPADPPAAGETAAAAEEPGTKGPVN